MKRLSVVLVFFMLAAVSPLFAAGQFNVRKPAIVDQDLVIKISDVSEYALFYPVEIDGFKMEVMAMKAPDNSIRTAFNACEVCYVLGKGYYVQKRAVIICQQCGDQFTFDKVEIVIGGCNPIPILPENKVITDSTITITQDYLKKAKARFEFMKAEEEKKGLSAVLEARKPG